MGYLRTHLVPVTIKCRNGIYTATTSYHKLTISAVITDLALIEACQEGNAKANYKIRQLIIGEYNAKVKQPEKEKYAQIYFTHDPFYSY